MPQMAPLKWLILFIFFTMVFMIFNIMNYYTFFIKPKKTSNLLTLNFKPFNWKW